ncbi:MAG: CHAT domain-containing protein [Candidatus Zixiibacteriota bacterium]
MRRLVDTDHKRLRTAIDQLLDDYLIAKAESRGSAVGMAGELSQWISSTYAAASGVNDYSRRYAIYSCWSADNAEARLRADSIFRSWDKSYRSKSKVDRIEHVNAALKRLDELAEVYSSINDSFTLASIQYYRGKVFLDGGEFDSCQYYLTTGANLADRLDHPAEVARCDLLLTYLYNVHLADYGSAERAAAAAEVAYLSIDSDDELVYLRGQRGYALQNLFQIDRAIAVFYDNYKEFQKNDSLADAAYCLLQIGESYYDKGVLDSAMYFARRARDMTEALTHERTVERANRMADLAYAESCIGMVSQAAGKLARAEEEYSRADSLFRLANDRDGQLINSNRKASLLQLRGDYEGAATLYRQILKSHAQFDTETEALVGLAACEYTLGYTAEALRICCLGIEKLERAFVTLPTADLRASATLLEMPLYELPAAIYLHRYEKTSDLTWLDSALSFVERGKAAALMATLSMSSMSLNGNSVMLLVDSISRLENLVILGLVDSTKAIAAIRRLQVSVQTKRANAPDDSFQRLTTDTKRVPTIASIQSQLYSNNQALVDYIVSDVGCYTICFLPDTVSVHRIALSRDSLRSMVVSYVNAISFPPTGRDGSSDVYNAARHLYETLIPQPLRLDMTGRMIFIVPDDQLFHLPFETLIDGHGLYLVESCEIAYLPSLRAYEYLMSRGRRDTGRFKVSVFASPLYISDRIAPLPNSEREAQAIRSVVGEEAIRAATGRDATESGFRDVDFSLISHLHLAVHGIFDEQLPSKSALLFSSDPRLPGDGLLTPSEIRGMHIPVTSAFLSACNSATGVYFPGEGIMSLARPFLAAGADNVIASVWAVDDRAAVDIVRAYYEELKFGRSPAHSLAISKRCMIHAERERYRHPYYWAPFILTGRN